MSSTQLRFRFCPEFLLHCLLHSCAAWLEPPFCKGSGVDSSVFNSPIEYQWIGGSSDASLFRATVAIAWLRGILSLNGVVVFACYLKKNLRFNQELKESVYITLLSRIIGELTADTIVVFDSFGKRDFEARIVRSFTDANNIENIYPGISEKEAGLQFIDNICSVIRLHKAGDKKDLFFGKIETMIKEV